jgi:hypothetical protein
LRTSDFDVLDHVNNARSLEAVEDELMRRLPGRQPLRARIEYRGTLERGDDVVLASAILPNGDGFAGDGVDGDAEGRDVLAVWLTVGGDLRVSATVTVGGPGRPS